MKQMEATIFQNDLTNGDPVAIVTDDNCIQLGTGYTNTGHVLRSISEACKGQTSTISFTLDEMRILTETDKVELYHGPAAILERKYRPVE